FSFHPVKPITTGEGGIITTNDKILYEKLKLFSSHGITKTDYSQAQGDWYYEMTHLGYNYRMNDIQATLGLSQLTKIDSFLQKRRHIAQLYNDYLSDIPAIVRPVQLDGVESGWHLYMIKIETNIVKKSRQEIFNDM